MGNKGGFRMLTGPVWYRTVQEGHVKPQAWPAVVVLWCVPAGCACGCDVARALEVPKELMSSSPMYYPARVVDLDAI